MTPASHTLDNTGIADMVDIPEAADTAPSPIRWPAEAVWQAVSPALPGFSVEIVPEIDSTNTELMRRARAGRTEPVLLLAERQTAGRGRLGRQWAGQGAGASLTFSLGLPLAPVDWSGLSLVIGVALAEALHPQLRLKWPNDLWWQDRKVGGILVETTATTTAAATMTAASVPTESRFAVIGVGLNIAMPRPADVAMRTPPAALRELLPGIDAADVWGRVAAPLVAATLAFAAGGFAPWQHRFERLDALRGRAVEMGDGQRGTAVGVDRQGALLLQTSAGIVAVHSAEASVRPMRDGGGSRGINGDQGKNSL